MGSVAEIIGRNSFNEHVRKITWGELANTLKKHTGLLIRHSDTKGVPVKRVEKKPRARIIPRFCCHCSSLILQFFPELEDL